MRQGDIATLKTAIIRSKEVGLQEWERSVHEEALQALSQRREARHQSQLDAAVEADTMRVEDMVSYIQEAFADGFEELPSFAAAVGKALRRYR